jgi:cytochrome-b5 reductase
MGINWRTVGFIGAMALGTTMIMDPIAGFGALLAGVGGALALNILFTKDKLIALNPDKAIPFKLREKKQLSHDSFLYRFDLQTPEHVLGLPVGQHFSLIANVDGKTVKRSYTPTSSDDEIGYFDLVIKVYRPCEKFPAGGKMSQIVDALNIGDTIDVQGPKGHITYKGQGRFEFAHKTKKNVPPQKKTVKKIGMLAGGTGITPMLQIVQDILKHPEDKTEVYIIFANQTERDILCREMLEEYAKDPRVHLWYTLDTAPEGWTYSEGFINKEMIQNHLPEAGDDVQVLICGPPPMIKYACRPNLEELGFTADQISVF